jgi:hypothetical protein
VEIQINCNGSAREEILLALKFNPPPTFKTVLSGQTWANENLSRGTYFELVANDGRTFYQGHTYKLRRHK